MNQFFLRRLWPTVVLILMVSVYVTCVKYGMTTLGALTAAAWTGFFAFLFTAMTIWESGGRMRMHNPVALWTTFFMAMAAIGPSVFVQRTSLVPASMLIVIMTFIAAGVVAYLLERFIIADQCGTWYIEYGLVPVAVLAGASYEAGGNHVLAGVAMATCWFTHFFWKQLPQMLESIGITRSLEDG